MQAPSIPSACKNELNQPYHMKEPTYYVHNYTYFAMLYFL